MAYHGQSSDRSHSLVPGYSSSLRIGDYPYQHNVRFNVVRSNDPSTRAAYWREAATQLSKRLMGLLVDGVMVVSEDSQTPTELRLAAKLHGFDRTLTSFQFVTETHSNPGSWETLSEGGLVISVGKDNISCAGNGHRLITSLGHIGLSSQFPVYVFRQPEFLPVDARSGDYLGEPVYAGRLGDPGLQDVLLNLDDTSAQR